VAKSSGQIFVRFKDYIYFLNIAYSADFNASVFHEDAIFLDLIDNMPTDTWQSILGTLIAMAVSCAFLISNENEYTIF
jgi:hypothetical protein